jgi:hypothetical protein
MSLNIYAFLSPLIVAPNLASANLIRRYVAMFCGFNGEASGGWPARSGAVLCVAMLLFGCGPTYPNGVIKDRSDAISAWRHQCAHDETGRYKESLVATLRSGEWTVGFHDKTAIVMAVFDAKSGKMKRCYYGVRN